MHSILQFFKSQNNNFLSNVILTATQKASIIPAFRELSVLVTMQSLVDKNLQAVPFIFLHTLAYFPFEFSCGNLEFI